MQTELHAKAFVSSKGQVVIPRNFRQTFNIHAGTELIFESHKGHFIVKPVNKNIESFFGSCKVDEEPIDVDSAIMLAVSDNDRA